MSTITIIGMVLNLIMMIFGEISSAKKEARERAKEFNLDQKKFFELVDKALVKMRETAKQENRDVGDVEDQIDRDLKG